MASFSFPALPLPVIPTQSPAAPVAPVAPLAPVALLQAEFDALPLLPLPSAQPAPALPAPGDAPDGAAMRPDQVVMARQLTWPAQDGGTLAGAWRGMVRDYGTQLAGREQQLRNGQLSTPLLLSGQMAMADPRLAPALNLANTPADAWRFTVHAGDARDQHLRVVQGDPEQSPRQRRRRGRAALRLELVLADGSIVTVQAEPVADGVMMEVWAPDERTALRLRELQPRMEAAIRQSGLRVLGWHYRASLPEGTVHARLPSAEAASALSLPVFRAMAELALLLPAGTSA